MEVYKITNLTLTRKEPGYNVHDYFFESAESVSFASREDAEQWLAENYRGDDEHGVGVTWEIIAADVDIEQWRCTDGNADIDIEADSATAAAQEYLDGGDWGDRSETIWIDVRCAPMICDELVIGAESESITVTLEAEEPDCIDGEDHDWQSPHEIVGGLEENPGVQGSGGGVVIMEVCSHCGAYKIIDTWAQRRDTGEQGLRSVEYRESDEKSIAWVNARRLAAVKEALSSTDWAFLADDGVETEPGRFVVSVVSAESDDCLDAIRGALPDYAEADFTGSSDTDADGDSTDDIAITFGL